MIGRPQVVEDLRLYLDPGRFSKHIKEANLPCTCDICNLAAYALEGNTCIHEFLNMESQTRNHFGNMATAVPVFKNGTYYEGTNLALCAIAYINKPREQMNDTQLNAIDRFEGCWKEWAEPLSCTDGSQAVPDSVLWDIVQYFSDIFFMSALPKRLRCFWTEPSGGCFAVAITHPEPEIEIHPTKGGPNHNIDRLCTLLHEAIRM